MKLKNIIIKILIIIAILILTFITIGIISVKYILGKYFPKENNVHNTNQSISNEPELMAKNISESSQEEKKQIYGADVIGYKLPGRTAKVKWKIFYADENNIYLIASENVKRSSLPYSTNENNEFTKNKPKMGSFTHNRSANFNNVIEDYSGSERIQDTKLKALNNDYFSKNYTSTNNNMKAVAYMMDMAAWNSKFLDTNNKADYVIGGPTVEMLIKSHNEKYGTSFIAEAISEAGYSLKKNENDEWRSYIDGLEVGDSLYGKENPSFPDSIASIFNILTNFKNIFDGYWLASPSEYKQSRYGEESNKTYPDALMTSLYYDGAINGGSAYSDVTLGFRPVVCLKNETRIQKISDSVYEIK